MIARTLAGLAALLPAALNAGPAAASSITVQLCTGEGPPRSLTIPSGKGGPGPDDDGSPCHAKGCHSGGWRKRAGCHI